MLQRSMPIPPPPGVSTGNRPRHQALKQACHSAAAARPARGKGQPIWALTAGQPLPPRPSGALPAIFALGCRLPVHLSDRPGKTKPIRQPPSIPAAKDPHSTQRSIGLAAPGSAPFLPPLSTATPQLQELAWHGKGMCAPPPPKLSYGTFTVLYLVRHHTPRLPHRCRAASPPHAQASARPRTLARGKTYPQNKP